MSGELDTLLQQAHDLGACLRLEGEAIAVEGPSPLPSELIMQLRERKTELRSYLEFRRIDSSFWLPFPVGFGGLPKAQVEAAKLIKDKLGIENPILYKYNILAWVRGYFQDRGENHGEFYEAIKREQCRLGQLLEKRSG